MTGRKERRNDRWGKEKEGRDLALFPKVEGVVRELGKERGIARPPRAVQRVATDVKSAKNGIISGTWVVYIK